MGEKNREFNEERGHKLSFSASFPKHEKLDVLISLFERGDFKKVALGARQLYQSDQADLSDEIKQAAKELEKRTKADPGQVILLILAVLLLCVLSTYFLFLHEHSR